ncbi:MAG: capsule assembly Wzi family protein [Alteromonadaceae bacterium]
MRKTLSIFFITLFLLFNIKLANANGVSPYLPLKTDPLIELEIERLAAISHLPILSKPYHIVTVVNYLKKIKHSHPQLFYRVSAYINRYKRKSAVTHLSTKLSTSDNKHSTIANNRGIKMDDLAQASAAGFYQFNQYAIANLGGTIVNGEKVIPYGSYISLGYEYAQFDIGYREHWLSPLQESATLLSTNAKPALSITMSNVKPIASWNVKYEFSIAQLEEMDGIRFGGTTSTGKPLLMTMHLSAQPFSWWTIGANRSFQFGGGDRSTGLSDIWKAVIDPVSADNCGSSGNDCGVNGEVGNQIASITNKFNFSIVDIPFSIYFKYAGEDTKEFKNYQLGNIAYTHGLFLPYLNDDLSFYAEYSKFHSVWYVHRLYDEGYRNDGTVIGHWWGNNKELNDGSPGNASLIRINWDFAQKYHLQTLFRTATIDSQDKSKYSRAKEIELSLTQVHKNGFINYSFKTGNDIYGESFYRATIGYSW